MPELNNSAAVVVLLVSRSLNRTQSCSPCERSEVHDLYPAGTCLWNTSNTKIRSFAIPHSCAAAVIFLNMSLSGSVIMNLLCDILMW